MSTGRPLGDLAAATIMVAVALKGVAIVAASPAGAAPIASTPGRLWTIRLRPHQDLKLELERFARENALQAGYVASAVGSLEQVAIRYANQPTCTTSTGHFEVVSLSGTLADSSDHLHIAVSDSTGRTIGGHLGAGGAPPGTLPPRARRVLALRDALDRDPAADVSAFFTRDSRTWFESRTGPGEPRDFSGHDAWADWDRYFHAVKSVQFASAGGDSVVFRLTESNDWYRLVDRAPSATELTYWFDDADRITGTLVRGLPQDPGAHGRLAEFKSWEAAHDPATLAYLLPDGKIAPDLARAKRWKQALTAWRKAAGLPAVR